MFTGIVEELGCVRHIAAGPSGGRLTVHGSLVTADLRVNDSVATNGVCLTAVEVEGETFSVDLVPETLSRTNLGRLRPGDRVDLERAVTLATRLGGHLVQGHIDGLATIVDRRDEGIQVSIRFTAAPDVMRYVVAKGFIALDGVSLTVVDTKDDTFTIALIPHSASLTTLGGKQVGDAVNVEVDVVAKYVERFVTPR